MLNRFTRTEALIGSAGLAKLASSRVAVFGVGGVGSYAVEALARAGIGFLALIDDANVSLTNINRQIHALDNTVGRPKVDVMRERLVLINPDLQVVSYPLFYSPLNTGEIFSQSYDYLVDAIDSVPAKVDLILRSRAQGIPLVSSMGAGNKLDPTLFRVADIAKTHTCPLARAVRMELRQAGVTSGVKVVFSTEPPRRPFFEAALYQDDVFGGTGRPAGPKSTIPASISFVPSAAGLILASVVVNDLIVNA